MSLKDTKSNIDPYVTTIWYYLSAKNITTAMLYAQEIITCISYEFESGILTKEEADEASRAVMDSLHTVTVEYFLAGRVTVGRA